MLGFLGLFAVSLVTAGYIVSTFVITTDVIEPFEVEYAILGDGGNYVSGMGSCADYNGDWSAIGDIDVGGLYAGEARKVCAKIENLGEGDLDYTFSGEVVSGLGNLVECTYAFGNPSVTGTVSGLSTVQVGALVNVAGDAAPAIDCEVTLAVDRS